MKGRRPLDVVQVNNVPRISAVYEEDIFTQQDHDVEHPCGSNVPASLARIGSQLRIVGKLGSSAAHAVRSLLAPHGPTVVHDVHTKIHIRGSAAHACARMLGVPPAIVDILETHEVAHDVAVPPTQFQGSLQPYQSIALHFALVVHDECCALRWDSAKRSSVLHTWHPTFLRW